MNTLPQLNEAENKFFESRGKEMAAEISGGTQESQAVEEGKPTEKDWIPASAGTPKRRGHKGA